MADSNVQHPINLPSYRKRRKAFILARCQARTERS